MSAIPKTIAYRNRRLLDLAHRIQQCQVQIPGTCTGFTLDGCEPAHMNGSAWGKGIGRKADDCYYAAACHACHREIDSGSSLSGEEREAYMLAGFRRTLLELWQRGLVRVA